MFARDATFPTETIIQDIPTSVSYVTPLFFKKLDEKTEPPKEALFQPYQKAIPASCYADFGHHEKNQKWKQEKSPDFYWLKNIGNREKNSCSTILT